MSVGKAGIADGKNLFFDFLFHVNLPPSGQGQ
jgi:hypothetical protein